MSNWVWAPVATPVLTVQTVGEYEYIPAGGITFAGTGAPLKGMEFIATGGITFAGEAPTDDYQFRFEFEYVMGGGLTFGGTGKLPQGWERQEMPTHNWVRDQDFGRGF